MKLTAIILMLAGLCLGMAAPAHAAMSSANYRITTTVMSGGGGAMGSSNYALTGTLGQPSPLIDPADLPSSLNYEMLTGFWYTIGGAGISNCPADLNADGSVNEDDLEMLADRFGQTLVGCGYRWGLGYGRQRSLRDGVRLEPHRLPGTLSSSKVSGLFRCWYCSNKTVEETACTTIIQLMQQGEQRFDQGE